MKRIVGLAIILAGLTACSLRGHGIPEAHIPFAKASFTVLGATNAEECGTYIFGLDFAHLFSNQGASMTASAGGQPADFLVSLVPGTVSSPEASRALYHAIERMPEATHLLQPRVHTTVTGIPLGPFVLFGQRCARVEARGVTIGSTPNPQQ